MNIYNSENNIRDIRPFCRPLFVTGVLWKVCFIPLTVAKPLRLDYQTLLKLHPPNHAGWIRPGSKVEIYLVTEKMKSRSKDDFRLMVCPKAYYSALFESV